MIADKQEPQPRLAMRHKDRVCEVCNSVGDIDWDVLDAMLKTGHEVVGLKYSLLNDVIRKNSIDATVVDRLAKIENLLATIIERV